MRPFREWLICPCQQHTSPPVATTLSAALYHQTRPAQHQTLPACHRPVSAPAHCSSPHRSPNARHSGPQPHTSGTFPYPGPCALRATLNLQPSTHLLHPKYSPACISSGMRLGSTPPGGSVSWGPHRKTATCTLFTPHQRRWLTVPHAIQEDYRVCAGA